MTLREHVTTTLLGIVGIGVPAEILIQVFPQANPAVVLGCVLLASFVGVLFGARLVSKRYEEEQDAEACPGCGVVTAEAVCHDYDCPEAQQ